MRIAVLFIAAGLALASLQVSAQAGHDHHKPAARAPASASSQLFDGEVRRVNKERGSVTLAHGPLDAFGMGPMTMSFSVKNPDTLDTVKVGDKVRFGLERTGDNLVVTRIEPVR